MSESSSIARPIVPLQDRVVFLNQEDGAEHVGLVFGIKTDAAGVTFVKANRGDAPWARVLRLAEPDARLGRVH